MVLKLIVKQASRGPLELEGDEDEGICRSIEKEDFCDCGHSASNQEFRLVFQEKELFDEVIVALVDDNLKVETAKLAIAVRDGVFDFLSFGVVNEGRLVLNPVGIHVTERVEICRYPLVHPGDFVAGHFLDAARRDVEVTDRVVWRICDLEEACDFLFLQDVVSHSSDPDPELVKILAGGILDAIRNDVEGLLHGHLSLVVLVQVRGHVRIHDGCESECGEEDDFKGRK